MIDVRTINLIDDRSGDETLCRGRDLKTGQWKWEWVSNGRLADAGIARSPSADWWLENDERWGKVA